MPEVKNLVEETSVDTGAGDFTVDGAIIAHRTFNTAFPFGAPLDVFWYSILHKTLNEFEIGTGHMSDATTLVRDTIIESSNGDAVVNFSAGDKKVINGIEAADYNSKGGADFQEFITPGADTWTKPVSAAFTANSRVLLEGWGPGGGGGQNFGTGAAGGGGGGGARRKIWLKLSDLGATETLNIGIGGLGGTADGVNGGDGDSTTIGTLLTAFPGAGGKATGGSNDMIGGGGAGEHGPGINGESGGAPGKIGGGEGGQGQTDEEGRDASTDAGGAGGGSGGISSSGGDGGDAIEGGAGGGGGDPVTTPLGGNSLNGGDGGNGGNVNGEDGEFPGGGGGGCETGTAGDGGNGRIRVTVFP